MGISGTGTVANLQFRAVGPVGSRTPLTLAVTTINQPSGTVPRIGLINGSITIVNEDGVVPGDCNDDGTLLVVDALCALEMSVKLIPVKLNMDMDKSGDVTSRDATLIVQQIDRQRLAR
jgi:hypothetical protein